MQISYNGVEALKEREGFKAGAYKDTGGVWTIGYGTTVMDGQPVQEGMCIDVPKATECLRVDCAFAQTAVNKLVKVPLKQNQFDALVSFVYNIGESAFSTSTLLKKLNARDFVGAASEFPKWVYDNGKKIDGLVNRRKSEQLQFCT